MIHIFVQQRLGDALQLTGIAAIKPDAEGRSILDASPLLADAITLAMLAMLVIGAFITYYLVEKPGRDLTRKWLGRTLTPAAQPAGASS
jgi:peptidoglycan/LPS O-acetylase OafA/YrhL